MGKAYHLTLLLSLLLLATTFVSTDFGLPFGDGGGFGLGGKSFGFQTPPLGPVHLPPINISSRWGDILHDTVQQALDLCKSVRMCNATAWYTDLDSECSDCHPCTCDEACYSRGDCCVDKVLQNVSGQRVLDTAPLASPVMACRSTYFTHELATHVFMKDTCPEDFHDTAVVDRCEHPPNETDSLWPVWSPATDTVYRNADCATCSNDSDHLVQWDLKMECNRGVYLGHSDSAVTITDRALQEPTCQVSYTAPKGCHPSPCRPVLGNYIDTCNVTGRRSSYDQALWKACEVFQGKVTVYDTYKNVFCAMCNEDSLEAFGACEDELFFPFRVVLNGSSFQRGPDKSASEPCGCKESEIYDKYEGRCRQLHCSMARTLTNGMCQSMVIDATGLSYDVAISLMSSDRQPVQLEDVSSLKQVARNIRTAFMLQGSTYSGWDVQTSYLRVIAQTGEAGGNSHSSNSDIQKALNVTRFKVHIRFSSMWSEPSETLESRLFALMISLWNISVDGKPKRSFTASPLFVKADTENDMNVYTQVGKVPAVGQFVEYAVDIPDQQSDSYDTSLFETSYYASLTAALGCPKVSFNLSHKTDTGDVLLKLDKDSGSVHHIPSSKIISFQFVEVRDDGVIMVCADQLYDSRCDTTFKKTDRPAQMEGVFSAEMVIVSVTFLTLSVLCLLGVFVVHVSFRELRTVSGRTTLGLVGTLGLATVLLEVGVLGVQPAAGCVAVGLAAHFFLLSALAWVAICMSHAYRDLRRAIDSSPDENRNRNGTRVCIGYVAMTVLVPALVVAGTVAVHQAGIHSDCGTFCSGYGNGVCFLSDRWSIILAAIFPVLLVFVLTLVLYILAARAVARLTCERQEVSRPGHQRLTAHVRISALMAVTWLTGLLSLVLRVDLLWYVFVVLCCLLAVYVAVVFLLGNKRALELCRARLAPCCVKEKQLNLKPDHKFTAIET